MSVDATTEAATVQDMVAKYTATVVDGKLVLDEPTDLPEGAQVDLTVDEWSPDLMSSEEREALWASIDRGMQQSKRGEGIPWEEAKARILAQRDA